MQRKEVARSNLLPRLFMTHELPVQEEREFVLGKVFERRTQAVMVHPKGHGLGRTSIFELPTRHFDQVRDHPLLPLSGFRLFRHQIRLQLPGGLIAGHGGQTKRGVVPAFEKNQSDRLAALRTANSQVARRINPQGLISLSYRYLPQILKLFKPLRGVEAELEERIIGLMTPALGRPEHGRHRLFRGWWMVIVAIVGLTFSLPTALVYTFGVFAKPLAAEFKSSRGSIALAVSLLDLMAAFTLPGAGRLVDHYGARRVIVPSLLALVACLVGLSFLQPPLWHLYALYVSAGVLAVASAPVTYGRVMANWFDRKRGLALGLAGTGVGLGAFITPSLAQYLIGKVGWRGAYIGLATATLLIAVPVVAIFFRGTPEEVGLLQDGEAALSTPTLRADFSAGMRVSEALRTRTFWQMCGIFFGVGACVTGATAHLVPLLTDHGVSGQLAALAASLFGVASVAGRVGSGYLVDRFFAPRVAAALFAGGAAGVAILWSGGTGSAVFLAATLLGLTMGAEADVMPFLVSRYFGMRSMAELYGCAFGSFTLGNATGRYLFAAGFDATGSYTKPLTAAFAVLALAAIATFGLGKYRRFPAA
jgi:sugar phosphate permease